MRKIKIIVENVITEAEIYDNKVADKIYESLPLEGKVNTWGDEIYFSIPVNIKPQKLQDKVEIGDIAYWSPGTALCIFFGKTPTSTNNEIKPASPVSVFGRILGDATVFKEVKSGSKIRVEKI